MKGMEDIDLAYNEELSGTLPLEWGAWLTRNSAPTASLSWTTCPWGWVKTCPNIDGCATNPGF